MKHNPISQMIDEQRDAECLILEINFEQVLEWMLNMKNESNPKWMLCFKNEICEKL